MKYFDTASRDASQTLAAWLSEVLTDEVTELRVQSGYFSADSLGLLIPLLSRAQSLNLPTSFVIGANDRTTTGKDVEKLFLLLGIPRTNAHLGVVSYGNALFHPKTYHVTRSDGSQAAYVGSANLTRQGLIQNIEAALVMDTRDSDDAHVLTKIAHAISSWFSPGRTGLVSIEAAEHIEQLVSDGVLAAESLGPSPNDTVTAGPTGPKRPGLSPIGTLPPAPGGNTPASSTNGQTINNPLEGTISPAGASIGAPSPATGSNSSPPNVAPKAVLTFGMTLQNTDVGVGKKTAHASGRSPEVFIPVKALDLSPAFWGWINQYQPGPKYVADASWAASHAGWIAAQKAKPQRKPRPLDKLDWPQVKLSLNGQPIEATIWFNPDKKDIRIRESSLRSAGDIDDIMLIRPAPVGSNRDYDIEIIKKQTSQYGSVLAKLTHPITNSRKRIGYF